MQDRIRPAIKADKRTPKSRVVSQPTAAVRAPPPFQIVGIGASAGGLEACRKLLNALPAVTGMAFVLVQHLDPTHESMMVDLLKSHTALNVLQAAEGMLIEAEHLYVIPPGTYLSVSDGMLHLSQPEARHGARLPFDFLLRSIAAEYRESAVCIVLSGTGADGSQGLKAVKENSGLVIVQDPEEAGYGGMPRSAMMTGAADLILPISGMPEALLAYGRTLGAAHDADPSQDRVPEIIALLRRETAFDFTLYKKGTLRRRIEQRMGLVGIDRNDPNRYLKLLGSDPAERDLLARALLINVTSFFRDPKVFDFLAETIIPDLIRRHPPNQPLRIWVAGCSTGEETYSLAMLFCEQLEAANLSIKLQVFASDVDPDAVASAREGLYAETIDAAVSPARLARFFTKEGSRYRILADLRALVVFTVQDILVDPPFARLDMVSCRNLLIYLNPEAQTQAASVFHFALREGGLLLLGASETVGTAPNRFEAVDKPARLYRRIGHNRPGDLNFLVNARDGTRPQIRPGYNLSSSRRSALGELCRRIVTEAYAPAAVLIDKQQQCLYSLGPTDRYLRMAPGQPSYDVLAMIRPNLRTKLRAAIQQADLATTPIIVAGGRAPRDSEMTPFNIEVRPIVNDGEKLLLICFVDEPKPPRRSTTPAAARDISRVSELELELEATRTEMRGAIRNLEISGEEQIAMNEEALSVNEEFQSTNEELLTSKEELQSLNEELTALNSQLQETLERQRTTSSDLQNILFSTDVATLFLDHTLNIRFFTPATRTLFSVIASDIGRPLADLNSLAVDGELGPDAQKVLQTQLPIEREIQTKAGLWFTRRILPYRAPDNTVEGVVITFIDVTEKKTAAKALEAAKHQAETATVAKSRFLAAASHDLRQPLQTLALLQGLLADKAEDKQSKDLVLQLDETVSAMSGILNTLLDINQIEAGVVRIDVVDFPVNKLLSRLKEEFTYHAQAKNLALHVVPCSLSVHSDPRLLEQMIRNLLSNALKYTKSGKVLLGCRRRRGVVRIEVWDMGIGIRQEEFQAIFEEYHQIDNAARERNLGLGLGLSIVQRLGNLLELPIRVRSQLGKGSGFAIEVPRLVGETEAEGSGSGPAVDAASTDDRHRKGRILIIEDDPKIRDLLDLVLTAEGHQTTTAADGIAALKLVGADHPAPDFILADYNLPNGPTGLRLIGKIRERFRRPIPAAILTGDISGATLREITDQGCTLLNKPVKLNILSRTIQDLLKVADDDTSPEMAEARSPTVIFVVDDDGNVRKKLRDMFEEAGRTVRDYPTAEGFLDAYRPGSEDCLLVDAALPGMSGLELLGRVSAAGYRLPAIMITGNSDVAMAVSAMKAGAFDFFEKPIRPLDLIAAVDRALEQSRDAGKLSAWRQSSANHLAHLTSRQRQIMDLVLAGHPSKTIAHELGISQRTVEVHRASIMKKTGAKSLPDLARLALSADSNPAGPHRRRWTDTL